MDEMSSLPLRGSRRSRCGLCGAKIAQASTTTVMHWLCEIPFGNLVDRLSHVKRMENRGTNNISAHLLLSGLDYGVSLFILYFCTFCFLVFSLSFIISSSAHLTHSHPFHEHILCTSCIPFTKQYAMTTL